MQQQTSTCLGLLYHEPRFAKVIASNPHLVSWQGLPSPFETEVMNAHARLDRLDLRNPRLVAAMLREMAPFFRELSKDQCSAVAPLTVMTVFSDDARVQYLSRCAELNMGLPVRMTQPAVLKQFRLLEDCLRLDYHPTNLPGQVQLWLQNLKAESEAGSAGYRLAMKKDDKRQKLESESVANPLNL